MTSPSKWPEIAEIPQPPAQIHRNSSQGAMTAARLAGGNHQPLRCPRCDSTNTKFCYYNNYSLSQPRHFCKSCKRYWTRGGTLRNVPIGGGCRKNKRSRKSSGSLSSLSPSSRRQIPSASLPVPESSSIPLLYSTFPSAQIPPVRSVEDELLRSPECPFSGGFPQDNSLLPWFQFQQQPLKQTPVEESFVFVPPLPSPGENLLGSVVADDNPFWI